MSTPVEWRPTSDQKEQVIWCLNFTKGIFHKKIVDSWIITNYRVLANNSEIWLKNIDDMQVLFQITTIIMLSLQLQKMQQRVHPPHREVEEVVPQTIQHLL
jgi:hypothetical protein